MPADGTTHPVKPTLIAKHGYRLDRYTGARIAVTFLSADDAGRRVHGWVAGHLADGSEHVGSDGVTYRLAVSVTPDWRVSAPVVAQASQVAA